MHYAIHKTHDPNTLATPTCSICIQMPHITSIRLSTLISIPITSSLYSLNFHSSRVALVEYDCFHLCFFHMHAIYSLRIHLDSRDIRYFCCPDIPEKALIRHHHMRREKTQAMMLLAMSVIGNQSKVWCHNFSPMWFLFLASKYLLIISGLSFRHFSANWISFKRFSLLSFIFLLCKPFFIASRYIV